MRKAFVMLLGILFPTPAHALPAQGLFVTLLPAPHAAGFEMDIGDVFQLGYVPEEIVANRIWYGSLRFPVSILAPGPWWPGLKGMLGYHRQQNPTGLMFQGIEYGMGLNQELPAGFSLFALGTLTRSLDARDTLPPLARLEMGIGFKAALGTRLFAGYQSWQSPLGLGVPGSGFAVAQTFAGWMIGADFQLAQLAGFPGDDERW